MLLNFMGLTIVIPVIPYLVTPYTTRVVLDVRPSPRLLRYFFLMIKNGVISAD
jgi:hypothetical protein